MMPSARAESVEVVWPSGLRQTFHDVAADKFYLAEEGKDALALQKFARAPRARREEKASVRRPERK